MTQHLATIEISPNLAPIPRNDYSTKIVTTVYRPLELRIARDREATFKSQLVKKNQTRITGMNNHILLLYAKDMSTREIAAACNTLSSRHSMHIRRLP